jgi:hypothetical protein
MKIETLILIGAGLYLYSKYASSSSLITPSPGSPGFVGPVPPPSSTVPPHVYTPTPVSTSSPVQGSGMQMCIAQDGHTFQWPSSQIGGCPTVLFVDGNVPYIIGDDGVTAIPLTY